LLQRNTKPPGKNIDRPTPPAKAGWSDVLYDDTIGLARNCSETCLLS
jgi:hypothetical protein